MKRMGQPERSKLNIVSLHSHSSKCKGVDKGMLGIETSVRDAENPKAAVDLYRRVMLIEPIEIGLTQGGGHCAPPPRAATTRSRMYRRTQRINTRPASPVGSMYCMMPGASRLRCDASVSRCVFGVSSTKTFFTRPVEVL